MMRFFRLLSLLALLLSVDAVAATYTITVTQGNSQCSAGSGTATFSYSTLSELATAVSNFSNGRGCPGYSVSPANLNPYTGYFQLICATVSSQCANQSFTAAVSNLSTGQCTPGTVRNGVSLATSQSGSVCSADGCAYSGSTSASAPVIGYYGTLSALKPYYQIIWTNTGKTCSQAGIPTGIGASLVDSPLSDAITCPSGQTLNVTGSTGTCTTPTDPGKAIQSGNNNNAPDPSMPGAGGGGSGSGAGGNPNNPMYFDKSGLATDALAAQNAAQAHADSLSMQGKQDTTNGKLDTLHNDLKNGVKLDETGTPSDGSLSQQKSDFDSAAQAKTDQINSVNGTSKVTALDWVWSPSIPAGQCQSLDFSGSWSPSLTLDFCSGGHIETIRAVMAWIYALAVCAYIWHRVSGATGAA